MKTIRASAEVPPRWPGRIHDVERLLVSAHRVVELLAQSSWQVSSLILGLLGNIPKPLICCVFRLLSDLFAAGHFVRKLVNLVVDGILRLLLHPAQIWTTL